MKAVKLQQRDGELVVGIAVEDSPSGLSVSETAAAKLPDREAGRR